MLTDNPEAVLVDCRTRPSGGSSGCPTCPASAATWCTSSGTRTDGTHNDGFVDDLLAAGVTPGERPVVFLCRSGNRSIGAAEAATAAGIAPSYNVLDGFEGDLDEQRHRGATGWQAVGLPWSAVMTEQHRCRRVRIPAPLPDGVSQATIGVRGGLLRSGFEETAEALYLTSGYVYESAADAEKAFTGEIDRYVYSRYGNPTISMFEERLRLIEGAPAAFATATGMAAVFTSLGALLGAGDRLVAARSLFGSCFVVCNEILPRWGVETVFVDGDDLDQWEEALSVPTQAVFFETPSNPMQSLVDIAAVCELAHAAGAKVVLDNVFATPLLQQGMPLGADVVVYSGTKHIDGQGRVLGGAILGDKEYIDGPVQKLMRHTGPAISAFNAWTLLKGLETLAVRVDYSTRSALPHRGVPGGPSGGAVGAATRSWPRIRSTTWPSGRCPAAGPSSRSSSMPPSGGKQRAFELLDEPAPDRHLQQSRRRQDA